MTDTNEIDIKKYTNDRIKVLEIRKEHRTILNENYNENVLKKLQSNVKKNTTFVRKLKNISESNIDGLLSDLTKINLSKYTSELADAVLKTKLKSSDLNHVVKVCVYIKKWYPTFGQELFKEMIKHFNDYLNTEKIGKFYIEFRLYHELILNGVFPFQDSIKQSLKYFKAMMTNINSDIIKYLHVLTSFTKHFSMDFMHILSKSLNTTNTDHLKDDIITKNIVSVYVGIFSKYFTILEKFFERQTKYLTDEKQRNQNSLKVKGEIYKNHLEHYEQSKRDHEKYLTYINQIAENFDKNKIVYKEEMLEEEELFMPPTFTTKDGKVSVFEDDNQRTFYEDIPDIPTKYIIVKPKKNSKEKPTELENKIDSNGSISKNCDNHSTECTDDSDSNALTKSKKLNFEGFDDFLGSLSKFINRDLIDKAAIDFMVKYNSKKNRKELIRIFLTVKWSRIDLLPFYSRFVCIINKAHTDILKSMIKSLIATFHYHVKSRDQLHLDQKLKTVRFIGELVKFKLYPLNEVMNHIKTLLHEFKHFDIDMLCTLLDTCGRFLYLNPETHNKMRVSLNVLNRKKTVHVYSPEQVSMIENSFFQCNPPEIDIQSIITYTPLELYIKYLITGEITFKNVNMIIKTLRKIDWKDEKLILFLTGIFCSPWNFRNNAIVYVAHILKYFFKYHPNWVVSVIDNIIEQIKLFLEIKNSKHQKTIALLSLFCCVYHCKLINEATVLNILFWMISFPEAQLNEMSILDTEGNTKHVITDNGTLETIIFHIKFICHIIENVGNVFKNTAFGKLFNIFIVYFERYYWKSKSIYQDLMPITVKYILIDTIKGVYSNRRMAINLNQVNDRLNSNNVMVDYNSDQDSSFVYYGKTDSSSDSDSVKSDDSDKSINSSYNENEQYDDELAEREIQDRQFQDEYDKIVRDSIEVNKSKRSETFVPINSHLIGNDENSAQKKTSNFILLTKESGKQQKHDILIPQDDEITINSQKRQKLALKEQQFKRDYVLRAQERQMQNDDTNSELGKAWFEHFHG